MKHIFSTQLSVSLASAFCLTALALGGKAAAEDAQAGAIETTAIQTTAIPSITAVSGIVRDGQMLTISGNGFGIKVPVEPYFYDNFESQPIGSAIVGKAGTVGSVKWKVYSGKTPPDNLYSREGYRGHGVIRASKMDNFSDGYIDGILSPQAYVSYRYKYAHTGNWRNPVDPNVTETHYSTVMKIFRMASLEGRNPIYSGQPSLLGTLQPESSWLYVIMSTNGLASGSTQKNIAPTLPLENRWYRFEGYMKQSEPAGAANGEFYIGTPKGHASSKDIVTRVAGSTALLNSFLLPFTSANGGTHEGDVLTQWADDAYFDNTQARVELCDKPLWSATDKECDIQIPRTQWIDNAIKVQVNQGQFANGQSVYLYVIDAAGQANANGYPMRVGRTSSVMVVDSLLLLD
ncbi:MAG: hypothetical protein V4805_14470 [Pseudomonadota bacterium]